MPIRALHLTSNTWDAHEAELEKLERVMGGLLHHFGLFEPFEDGEEWTLERAEERLLRQGPVHPLVYAASRAMKCVLRSYFGAASAREETLTLLIELREFLKTVHRMVGVYQKERPAADLALTWTPGSPACGQLDRQDADTEIAVADSGIGAVRTAGSPSCGHPDRRCGQPDRRHVDTGIGCADSQIAA